MNWAGLGGGPLFFFTFVARAAAVAAGNVVLERRGFATRGYAIGVALSVAANTLLCGLCGPMR